MAFGYGDLAVSSFRSGMGPQMITADTAREFVDSAGQPAAHFQQRGADGAPGAPPGTPDMVHGGGARLVCTAIHGAHRASLRG
ncbi:hypothetical protein CYMTET_46043 [Cymbomonas tetramitiformis]|uniref:Uncharacterized protein n=1 Tax=Cymbomonas tetramitiformis TaxID=36881 RepID=A0AAE0BYS9_9CHLO|nr:hypothetical protein CYMTET_46043 [Cymbomonas tetramitiformis]